MNAYQIVKDRITHIVFATSLEDALKLFRCGEYIRVEESSTVHIK